jgi:predicted RNA-binding Zn-ribbon protein involved in translation (DUF1610 family)
MKYLRECPECGDHIERSSEWRDTAGMCVLCAYHRDIEEYYEEAEPVDEYWSEQ